MKLAILSLSLGLIVVLHMEAQAWEKPLEKWTEVEARRVLTDSPWAKQTGPSKLIVRWESAAPVAHARRIMNSILLDAAAGAVYRISIAGLPGDPGNSTKASLQYSGREPINMSSSQVRRDRDEALLVVFEFPKTEPVRNPGVFRLLPFGIRIRPNEFQFAAEAGAIEIRQTFDLRDMIFLRDLAL
jgi:hypothetical protein